MVPIVDATLQPLVQMLNDGVVLVWMSADMSNPHKHVTNIDGVHPPMRKLLKPKKCCIALTYSDLTCSLKDKISKILRA